jgi:hypothetical protein
MSYYYDIVKSVYDDLFTNLSSYGVPFILRRRPVYRQGDPLPCVIVSVGDEEKLAQMDFDRGTTWVYPVIVNLIYPDDRNVNLELETQEYLDFREAIRDRLFVPIMGVYTVWDVNIEGTKPFMLADQKSTYSSTIWTLKYSSKEQRREP